MPFESALAPLRPNKLYPISSACKNIQLLFDSTSAPRQLILFIPFLLNTHIYPDDRAVSNSVIPSATLTNRPIDRSLHHLSITKTCILDLPLFDNSNQEFEFLMAVELVILVERWVLRRRYLELTRCLSYSHSLEMCLLRL